MARIQYKQRRRRMDEQRDGGLTEARRGPGGMGLGLSVAEEERSERVSGWRRRCRQWRRIGAALSSFPSPILTFLVSDVLGSDADPAWQGQGGSGEAVALSVRRSYWGEEGERGELLLISGHGKMLAWQRGIF